MQVMSAIDQLRVLMMTQWGAEEGKDLGSDPQAVLNAANR